MGKIITRTEYMSNSSELFTTYHSQFINENTRDFIINTIGLDKLKSSKCPHLNDLFSHSHGGRGGWVWDFTPLDLGKAREAGAVSKNALPSPAFHTCVGKVCANLMLAESK
jgi:hypothetical protein